MNIFVISAFVGGDPKPQHLERTRVVGIEASANQQRINSANQQRYKSHRRHHPTPNPIENQQKKSELNKKFKLWEDGPNFDTSLRQNVVALVGRTAYLTCRVFDRGNKTVRFMLWHSGASALLIFNIINYFLKFKILNSWHLKFIVLKERS